MHYWEIVGRAASLTAGTSTSTLVLYALVLTAVAAYAQILRDINDELAGH
ncbi:hypothetical protein AB0F43_31350 [Kribbella sp. NPDC023972]